MIVDHLDNADRYAALHPGFAPGFDFLRTATSAGLKPGRYEVEGERLFVIVANEQGKGQASAKLEVHRRYIDIQFTLPQPRDSARLERIAESEHIGWCPLAECHQAEADYDESRDIQFFLDRPETWLSLPAGVFAIFHPDDAHAPLAGEKPVSKAIVKVALNW